MTGDEFPPQLVTSERGHTGEDQVSKLERIIPAFLSIFDHHVTIYMSQLSHSLPPLSLDRRMHIKIDNRVGCGQSSGHKIVPHLGKSLDAMRYNIFTIPVVNFTRITI